MFLLEEVLAYGAVLVALSVLTTLGVKQLLAGKNKTEVREEWSDNPKPMKRWSFARPPGALP